MKITTIFVDLDGVMVDWLGGIRELAGKPDSIYDSIRQNHSSLNYKTVNEIYGGRPVLDDLQKQCTHEWWLNLRQFEYANFLITRLSSEFPVAFLTSPGKSTTSASAKLEWQKTNYPAIPILIGKYKYLAASESKVLIDDDKWQLDNFEEHGGFSVQWPNQFALEGINMKEIGELVSDIINRIKLYENRISYYEYERDRRVSL
jgi:5'(3')-deoxyribonucleotidase